ncbi:MAG: acetyl-CoA carboxylase, carboxyltransferase subunit beta [Acholeplasmataceae bacterium]|nr:acetyl-CoA carboxylase, carboxyltransferase subunit beta [Acholeplasmataceae bacterium]
MNDFLSERKKRLDEFHQNIRKKNVQTTPTTIPDGLFVKCVNCGAAVYEKQVSSNHDLCPHCDYHFRMSATRRLSITVDQGSYQNLFGDIVSLNPLGMPDYEEKKAIANTLSRQPEAILTGTALIVRIKVAIAVMESAYMMGSMGSAVGEKLTRLIEHALDQGLPLIIFSASGGARMQEGLYSLMQMAKTASALRRFADAGLLFVSVMTNPTTGGVAASFASLGDIIIAEQSSLIGFAGARVIKQTIKASLPEGFQTAEFQLEHGQVDLVCHRLDLRKTLHKILKLHQGGRP